MKLSDCRKGNHDLIEILESPDSYGGSSAVARWCRNCGAIVVDIDYDGRTNPGHYKKMKFTEIFKEKINHETN